MSEQLAQLIPLNANVLDVGCGDGLIVHLISKLRPDLKIQGIDVSVRKQTHIDVTVFDGFKIPFEDRSFDVVMFVDVLHHTDDPAVLLKEASRVTRKSIILKDHLVRGILANETLRFMDKVGNEQHGVVLPYNYWKPEQWNDTFRALSLKIDSWRTKINLYPLPLNILFGRSLHFIASLSK